MAKKEKNTASSQQQGQTVATVPVNQPTSTSSASASAPAAAQPTGEVQSPNIATAAPQPQQTPAQTDSYNSGEDNLYNQLKDAYGESVAQMGTMVQYLEEEKRKKELENAKAAKRENRQAFISHLGDALSGVANLVGVSMGASNQNIRGVAPELEKKYGALQATRKQDMDNLSGKLDKIKQDQLQAKLAMQLGLTEFQAQREKAAAEEKAREEALAETKRQFDIESGQRAYALETDRINAKTRKEQAENAGNKDGGKGNGGSSSATRMVDFIYKDEKGNPMTIKVSKDNLEAVKSWALPILQNDYAKNTEKFSDWNDYRNAMGNKNDKRIDELTEEQRNILSDLSSAFDDDELVNMINRYGPTSPAFIEAMKKIGISGQSRQPVGDEAYDEFK